MLLLRARHVITPPLNCGVRRHGNVMPTPSVDFVYWTFSAASQSIAAFIAFLLTGYALVHTMMDSARERDDTLEEIHAALRKTYHRRLTVLATVTGAAVVLSLVAVYFNRPTAPLSGWVVLAVSIVDVGAIVAGLYFVVSIVDPRKYERVAKKAIKEETHAATGTTPSAAFFDAFLHLERLVRDYLRQREFYVPSRGVPRMSFSFRQMIEALRTNEVIDRATYDELMDLNKYRNLVFHGHLDQVDPKMIARARELAARIAILQ
jgi:hypothetical protein